MEYEMWLSRDKNDDLFLYTGSKPIKCDSFWLCLKQAYMSVKIDEKEYPEVKWSDEEPTKVKLVIDK